MDNDHNLIITPKGQYVYDPDYDCYYRVCTREDLTHWNQFGWIYVIAILSAVCFYVERLH
jgi:hypothetical protein